jgi:hypothetical protein
MARAVRTSSPLGFTDLRWPTGIESPCSATIMPKPPEAIRSTAATPKRVLDLLDRAVVPDPVTASMQDSLRRDSYCRWRASDIAN